MLCPPVPGRALSFEHPSASYIPAPLPTCRSFLFSLDSRLALAIRTIADLGCLHLLGRHKVRPTSGPRGEIRGHLWKHSGGRKASVQGQNTTPLFSSSKQEGNLGVLGQRKGNLRWM
uniref:Uncharacterized protein n=1 Tax=Mus musculus TaxID=10090 RepID=Q3V3J4_MOUSE|nr:unnamed protein product [Mus musculus]